MKVTDPARGSRLLTTGKKVRALDSLMEIDAPLWFRAISRQLGLPAPRVGRVRCTRSLRVPMADGVSLLADHWHPIGVSQAPLLLVRTPYGRGGPTGLLYGRFFAHQGFQVVVQSCRGTAGSEGAFDRPFLAETDDGAATVKWLLDQSWYPGSFATVGGSYLGYTQLALAQAAQGHQSAAVLQVAPISVRDIVWPDGTFALQASLSWAAMAHDNPAPSVLRSLLSQRRLSRTVPAAGTAAPLGSGYRLASGDRVPFFEDWLHHPDADDPWWHPVDQRDAIDHLNCPVLVQAGWYDVFLESSLQLYQRLRERGVDAELSVGPWSHLSFGTKGAGRTLGEAAEFLREVVELRPRQPRPRRVRLVEIGSGIQSQLADWPSHATSTKILHLASRRLTESPTDGATTTTYTYEPDDPTPHVGGATLELRGGPRENGKHERRPDVCTFDSGPLTADIHVLGNVRIAMRFGSDRPSTALFLRICQVDAKGHSINITDRLLTLLGQAREADATWHIDALLPPTAARIPAGSRLRLQVSSGAYPRCARHPGTDEVITRATQFHPAQQVIHHSIQFPATVELPLAAEWLSPGPERAAAFRGGASVRGISMTEGQGA